MVDSDAICYSTLELANLQYFTFVIGLIYNRLKYKTDVACWVNVLFPMLGYWCWYIH